MASTSVPARYYSIALIDVESSIVLSYLQKTNRPYSAIDVFTNLNGALPKAQVVKILAELQSKELIMGKTYGKQQIYVARQDNLESASSEELASLDSQIRKQLEKTGELKKELVLANSELKVLENEPSNLEIEQRKKEIDQEIEVLSQKEAALGTQLGFEPTEEEIKEVDKLYSKYRGDWKIRKKICEELIAVLKDSVPNYSNTMEEIGLDLIDETPFKQNPLSL